MGWLLKKHKGSRKHNLIAAKTKVIHNRTRWTASIREGEKTLQAYQWLPTPKDLLRRHYYQKGKDGFPHPYLMEEESTEQDYPMGEAGPDETIYTATVGARSSRAARNEPLELAELKLRVRMRDDYKCVRCGSTENLHVHHKKGTKSHSLDDLETLCLTCHKAEHGYRQTTN